MKRNDPMPTLAGGPLTITEAMLAATAGGAQQQSSDQQQQQDQGPGLDKKTAGPTGKVYQAWTETFGVPHPNARHRPTIFERMAPPPAAEGEGTQQTQQQ
jgi:hypothetical protein